MHYSRAFELTSAQTYGLYPFYNLSEVFGQSPYDYPTVFSFYLPDYQPNGAIQDRGLYAPEFQIHNDIAAGVNGLRLDIINMSEDDDVYLRVAIGNRASPQQSGGTWWISKNAVLIPTEPDWMSALLPIYASDMQVVGNIEGQTDNQSFEETFSDIRNIRILSSSFPSGAIGDEFIGDVGIDNVALVPESSTVPLIGVGIVMLTLYKRQCKSEELPDIPRERLRR